LLGADRDQRHRRRPRGQSPRGVRAGGIRHHQERRERQMKSLKTGFVFLLLSSVSACGQQLVEFGPAGTVTSDIAIAPDVAMTSDIAPRVDISMAPDLEMVDMALPDMAFPPSPNAACAAMLGSSESFAV